MRMKELQSQKARIVAQMVPAQASRAYSPFEDTENIPISASEDVHALVDHLINQDAGIIAGRQVLTNLIKGLNSTAILDMEPCTLSRAIMCHQLRRTSMCRIAQRGIPILTYVQVNLLEFELADILEHEKDWSGAARVLRGINLEVSQQCPNLFQSRESLC